MAYRSPAFSERALTIGKGKLSAGFNFLYRSYDKLDGLDLGGFELSRLQAPQSSGDYVTFELRAHTNTLAAFADYGLLDNLDVGVLLPYVFLSLKGATRIYAIGPHFNGEVQRILINASASGVGDVAIFGKYRFWSQQPESPARGRCRAAWLPLSAFASRAVTRTISLD